MMTSPVEIKSHYTSLQEVFDRIWYCFAVEKNELAKKPNGISCSYTELPHYDNRCGCAIGCLFQPSDRPGLERHGPVGPNIKQRVKKFAPILDLSSEDLGELQARHDSATDRLHFVDRLRSFAADHKLTLQEVEST